MNVPASNSLSWIYSRQTWVGLCLLGFAAFGYHNHMSVTDIMMIVTTMAGLFGIDIVKHNVAPPPSVEGPPIDQPIKPRLSGDQ